MLNPVMTNNGDNYTHPGKPGQPNFTKINIGPAKKLTYNNPSGSLVNSPRVTIQEIN